MWETLASKDESTISTIFLKAFQSIVLEYGVEPIIINFGPYPMTTFGPQLISIVPILRSIPYDILFDHISDIFTIDSCVGCSPYSKSIVIIVSPWRQKYQRCCLIHLATRMWLNIGICAFGQTFGSICYHLLQFIGKHTNSIIPTSRITFRIFVNEDIGLLVL